MPTIKIAVIIISFINYNNENICKANIFFELSAIQNQYERVCSGWSSSYPGEQMAYLGLFDLFQASVVDGRSNEFEVYD